MRARDYPFLDRRFVAMAHRGGWLTDADRARENTSHAFAQAVALGYEYLEVDVRTTADGEVVVFHDARLERVTDAAGPISERTWAELASVRVAGTDPVPRLADALAAFPQTRFNIDLKDDRSVQPLAELLVQPDVVGRVCVGSFSGSRLRAFRRVAPTVLTGVTPIGVAWDGFALLLRRLRVDPGAVLQIPSRVLAERVPLVRRDLVDFVHATGRQVHVWTIDDAAEMERLIDLGVDGIITNDLAALRRILIERDLWEERT